jgi:hypothetical protein
VLINGIFSHPAGAPLWEERCIIFFWDYELLLLVYLRYSVALLRSVPSYLLLSYLDRDFSLMAFIGTALSHVSFMYFLLDAAMS